jgi:hypothetical protein
MGNAVSKPQQGVLGRPTIIHPDLFQTEQKITGNKIHSIVGPTAVNWSDSQVEEVRCRIYNFCSEVKSFAVNQIEWRIAEYIGKHIPKVRNFQDVLTVWSNDEAGELVELYWWAVYGQFDRDPGWARKLRDVFCSKQAIAIKQSPEDDNPNKKDCVQR